jgi:hypothetical protein
MEIAALVADKTVAFGRRLERQPSPYRSAVAPYERF